LRGAAFLFAAALGLLAGCSTVDGVRFGRPLNCPDQIVEVLTVRPSELGPWSETDTLECALSWLQDTDDPTVRRSALGSRLSLHLAERTPEADEREYLAAEGVRFAEAAIALGADGDGAVHYYLAANLGLVVRDHVTLAMENLPRLQGEMQRAVDLSPEIDHGGPLRLLGILYHKAPLAGGVRRQRKGARFTARGRRKTPGPSAQPPVLRGGPLGGGRIEPRRAHRDRAGHRDEAARGGKLGLQPRALEKRVRPVSGRYRGIGPIDPYAAIVIQNDFDKFRGPFSLREGCRVGKGSPSGVQTRRPATGNEIKGRRFGRHQ
jgi:hypothetical protein